MPYSHHSNRLFPLTHSFARSYHTPTHTYIQPENILLAVAGPSPHSSSSQDDDEDDDAQMPYTIKLGDFGLARHAAPRIPLEGTSDGRGGHDRGSPQLFTPYVSTRWYRAPEILLRAAAQTTAVDVWAAGAVMAEVWSLQPLLPGE